MIRVAVTSARTHLAGRATAALVASMLLVVGGAVSATADGGGKGTGTGSAGVADPVPTTTHITCESPQTFTGKALTPCTATVTAKDGSKTWSVPVSYKDNVNAGTAHVSAGRADVAGCQGSNAFTTFTINKAPTSTRISCPSVVPYTGQPVEPSSAALLMGTQLGELSVRYRDNTGPGIAYATAMFPGDSKYTASGAEQTFLIGAPTTVTVTCASGSTYTGSALTPCTATAKATTGSPSPPSSLPTATTSTPARPRPPRRMPVMAPGASGAPARRPFTIAKAPSVVTVECAPASVVYTGAAFTPCTSTVTGAGALAAAVATVTYRSNTGAGTATAAATYAGDSNHLGATGSTTFTIEKAPVAVSLTCPASADFTGATLTPCTATATGPGGLTTTVPVTYTSNTYPGTATATATFAGDANHLSVTATATFKVIGFTLKGYYPPVWTFDTATFWNVARAGSTVLLKFEAFLPNGTEITNPTTLGATFTTTRVPCTATPPTFPNTGPAISGDATISYDTRSGQFARRWKTAKGVTVLLPRHHHERRPLPADRVLHPALTHAEGSTSGHESPESTTKRPQTAATACQGRAR